MEIRLNLVLLAVLGLTWAALSPSEPVAALDPTAAETRELAQLEDEFARDRGNVLLARHLSFRYLELERPGPAVAILRAADPDLLDDPMLMHRLAQAYARSGRMQDAVATAELAVARCGRSLGAAGASGVTPPPRFECGARDYATLDMHRTALSHMVRWGVQDADADPRALRAYDIAQRRATVASAR